MNLASEYLVRSKVTQNVVKFPLNLALENSSNNQHKLWLLLEEQETNVKISTWDLNNIYLDENINAVRPPKPVETLIARDQLFVEYCVIPRNYKCLKYSLPSIPTQHNEYAHPMDKILYEQPFLNIKNDNSFTQCKHGWLLNSYIEKAAIINIRLPDTFERYEHYYKSCLETLSSYNRKIYDNWWQFLADIRYLEKELVGEFVFMYNL